jgi:hypothetical protein
VAEVEHPVLLQPAHLVHELARLVGCHLASLFLCSAKLGYGPMEEKCTS